MYCKNCGKEVDNSLAQCPYCNTPMTQQTTISQDSGSVCWGVLGCCIPIIGLVLYIVWKDTKPKSGKSAGIGALIGVILILVIYFTLFILFYSINTAISI